MNKTYKIMLPRNKEAQNIRTNIKDGTIEVEVELKEKWEPKDGEICFAMTSSGIWKFILIYGKSDRPCIYNENHSGWVLDYRTNWGYSIIRPATDSEKQLLFDALDNEGKMWDAERKQVVDLPKQAVEPPRRGWEPKDGDVCFISARYNHLIIFRKFKNDIISSYVNTTFAYDQTDESGTDICDIKDVVEFRPATDLERLELFHKMMKKGKMWDAENRKVVDYPMWDKKGDVKNSKE